MHRPVSMSSAFLQSFSAPVSSSISPYLLSSTSPSASVIDEQGVAQAISELSEVQYCITSGRLCWNRLFNLHNSSFGFRHLFIQSSELRLFHSHLGSASAVHLACRVIDVTSLQYITSITLLDLGGNRLGDAGAQTLALALAGSILFFLRVQIFPLSSVHSVTFFLCRCVWPNRQLDDSFAVLGRQSDWCHRRLITRLRYRHKC